MDSDTYTSSSEEGDDPWEDAAGLYMDFRNNAVQMRGPGQMFEVNLGDGIRMVTNIHLGNGVHLGAGAQVNGVHVDLRGVHLGAGAQVNGVHVDLRGAHLGAGAQVNGVHVDLRGVHLGAGAQVNGVHVDHRGVHLGAGAQVNGVHVDHRGIHLGAGAQVNGVHVVHRSVHLGAGAQVNEVHVDHRGVRLVTVQRGDIQQRVGWLGRAHRGGFRLGPIRQGGVQQGRVQRREELRQRRGRLELCRRCGKIHRAGACTESRPVAEHHERNRECPICLEAVGVAGGGGDDVVLLCGHAFHYDCVAPWCRRRPTCPICRTRLEQPD